MGRSQKPDLSQITAWITIRFKNLNGWQRNNGKQAKRCRGSTAISNSGHMCAARMGIARTKRHERLSRYARSTLGLCWSLNGYARSNHLAGANQGGSIANKPT